MSSKNNNQQKPSATPQQAADDTTPQRRRYNSPLRQQQTADTKERIIAAGAELVHQLPAWDWTNITARAVGERAGISERTVHRYFPTERKLRDAVIQRMVQESGVSIGELKLDDFAGITKIMFSYLMSFAAQPLTTPVLDPSLATMDQIRCSALRNAIAQATPGWSERDRENAAAVLDIFWNLPPYERLIQVWGFDADRAVGLMTWLIGLVNEAIRNGKHPVTDA
ncbi:MAG TPA: TetR/AcrR family transcriptional regulator [Spongiibacteraceae bacterium]|nr:TetR/AcrR family transcriptional regulator [Spongiibacteraceae bacterium]